MRIGFAAVVGLSTAAIVGALFGLHTVATSEPAVPRRQIGVATPSSTSHSAELPRALTPVQAYELLLNTTRQRRFSDGRGEFQRLLEIAGSSCSKEELLTLAAASRRSDVMEWLLAAGALPGGGIHRPAAPLVAAAGSGDIVAVRLLLRAGAKPDPVISDDRPRMHPTPLIAAICSGSLDCADALVQAGADPRRPVQISGSTIDAVRRPPVLRTSPNEARRLRPMTALGLAELSPNAAMAMIVGRKRAPQRSTGLLSSAKR